MNRKQFRERAQALRKVQGKLCLICGLPSSCVVLDNGFQPACYMHGLSAQRIGYTVYFPEDTRQKQAETTA